jgi:hypothetical protein
MAVIYEVELWSRNGVLLADISKYIKNFSYSMQRNEAEQLQFDIDLNIYESLCTSLGVHPTSILGPYQTDVKVKRNGTYLFGSHVGYLSVNMGEISSTISVRCFGYLNLFLDRYVTATYTQEDETDIAWDLIDSTQSQTNGNMGITRGPNQVTTIARDRTYDRQNVKDGITNLVSLVDGNFDFEFTYDKKFNTYTQIGSDLSDTVEFIYPRNIKSVVVPRDGIALANKIYGLGSGFGDEALFSTQFDNDSELNYGVHEKIITWNSVVEQETLDDNTAAQVSLMKGLLEIPQMIVDGVNFDLNLYGIGDRVTVRIEQHPFLATVTGKYRVEKLNVRVDEQEGEEITVYFDNYGVIQNE